MKSRTLELYLLFAVFSVSFILHGNAQHREVTHEDLGNALVALAKEIRENSARLERHELRERTLGEHLKKTLATLEKRLNGQENELKNMRSILEKGLHDQEYKRDMRTSMRNLEQDIQKKSQQEELFMLRLVSEIESMKSVHGTERETAASGIPSSELQEWRERLNEIVDTLRQTSPGISDLVQVVENVRVTADSLTASESMWKQHGEKSEQVLAELKETAEKIKTGVNVETNDDEDTGRPTLGAILDNVEATQRILIEGLAQFNENTHEKSNNHDNVTLEALARIREDILDANKRSAERISIDLQSAREVLSGHNKHINMVLSEVREDESKGLEALRSIEQVLLQAADGVMDVKRRIEFGVQWVISESNESMKGKMESLNHTLSDQLVLLSKTILTNQTVSLANLSSRLESEISQVWRQIGIMYRELTQSAGTLNRLQNQTEFYVNGSLTTMDNMSGKVGLLSNRMGEVDSNLSYLLGRLSLISQEFNLIKSSLRDALDQARRDFAELQEKLPPVNSSDSAKHNAPEPLDDNQVLTGTNYDLALDYTRRR